MMEIVQLVVDCLLLIFTFSLLDFIAFQVRKHNLEHWIKKTLNAAELLYDSPGLSAEKREFVMNFLEENHLTRGISKDVVDALLLSTAQDLYMQNNSTIKLIK